jgi:hypothetical protein
MRAVAMTGQAPRATAKPPRPAPAARAAAPKRNPTLEKRQAKKVARAQQEARQEMIRRQDEAAAAARAERLLPYQLEAQRQMLENQRQMLKRQSEIERNAALRRMASAMEQAARRPTFDDRWTTYWKMSDLSRAMPR